MKLCTFTCLLSHINNANLASGHHSKLKWDFVVFILADENIDRAISAPVSGRRAKRVALVSKILYLGAIYILQTHQLLNATLREQVRIRIGAIQRAIPLEHKQIESAILLAPRR